MLSNRQKKWKTPNMLRMMKDEDSKDINEILDELNEDFHAEGSDCFNHCSKEKIKCLDKAVETMLHY